MDRHTIESLLEPVLDLRLVCNHPQLVLHKRAFNQGMGGGAGGNHVRKQRLLTMEASLQLLMKKTQAECDNHFRSCVMHLNGMAGLSILMGDVDAALDIYERVLTVARTDYQDSVSLDRLQKVHTLHNYSDMLRQKHQKHGGEDERVREKLGEMQRQMLECERAYLVNFEEKKAKSAIKFIEKKDLVRRDKKVGIDLYINLKNTKRYLNPNPKSLL